MIWLKLFGLALQFGILIIQYLERQSAIKEGEARAVEILLEKANDLANRAASGRVSVSDDPDAILRDEYNRDSDADRKALAEAGVRVVLPGEVQPDQGQPGVGQPKPPE